MKKTILKRTASVLALATISATLVACGGGNNGDGGKTYDNDSTPLVLATQTPDGVFNPFFSTSAYDGEIAGTTQISMLGTDPEGGVKVGADQDTVVLDYSITTTDNRTDKTDDEDFENYYTTYKFLIKNDLKFSNGSDITIKDVLFNMYVYLDPTYSGSTTMYSVDIQGLKAYRAQSLDEGEQKGMEEHFNQLASARIANIRYLCTDKLNENDAATLATTIGDIERMKPLFKKELESDWNSATSSISSYDTTYKFTAAWQVFLWNYGYIGIKKQNDATWNKETMGTECPEAIEWNGWNTRGAQHADDKDYFINAIYEDKVGTTTLTTSNYKTELMNNDSLKSNIYSIVTYYGTASTLRTQLVAQATSDYYAETTKDGKLVVENISGITTYKTSDFSGVNETKTYDSEHDVLQIVINGVDPKAIWNFGFTVSPMYYYSTAEEVAKADPATNHFGVTFGSIDFMNQLQSKLVPVGGGAYMVTTKYGDASAVSKVADFFDSNIVYYERNPYFYQPAKIKYLRYKVISSNKLFDSVVTGDVDYADPSAKVETVNDVKNKYSDRIETVLVDNNGYGYIGINAKYVQSLAVRRLMMYCMDTSLVLDYYKNDMGSVIYRSMSTVSWAYPKGATSYYGYIKNDYTTFEEQKEYIQDVLVDDGWKMNLTDKLYHRVNPISGKDESLTYTFTLAGETTDHPAYNTMYQCAQLLNQCGFKITVTNDATALSKLSNGSLAVWAAAWGSTIDPDMYQVYHKDSKATSVNNWGYRFMMDNSAYFDDEMETIETLSDLIDDGRKTVVQSERKDIYSQALDKVMELAVELPTYQRKNLFVYNKAKIDKESLCKTITPYSGPLSRIWEVSFVGNSK